VPLLVLVPQPFAEEMPAPRLARWEEEEEGGNIDARGLVFLLDDEGGRR